MFVAGLDENRSAARFQHARILMKNAVEVTHVMQRVVTKQMTKCGVWEWHFMAVAGREIDQRRIYPRIGTNSPLNTAIEIDMNIKGSYALPHPGDKFGDPA